MMRPPFDRASCGPPWRSSRGWPRRGPWPGDAMRVRFFRRFIWVAAAVMMCAVVGVATLAWFAAEQLRVAAAPPIAVSLAIFGAFLSVSLVVGVIRRVSVPLRGIMDGADRVADGDYEVRVPEAGSPPVRSLAHAFNTMTARLQANDRIRRDLMADIAHELRTPLTVIQGRLEGLLDGVYPRDDAQVRDLLHETHVLARLVDDLRTLALSESGALALEREPTDIGVLIADAVRAASEAASARGVVIETAAGALPPLDVDPVRVRQVIANLLSNALRHTPAGGRVSVVAQPRRGDGVSVEVRDTGVGMTPDVLAHVFDRFYKGAGSRGSGLGLTIAKHLVAAHGGDITASSAPGEGTTFRFTLPGAS